MPRPKRAAAQKASAIIEINSDDADNDLLENVAPVPKASRRKGRTAKDFYVDEEDDQNLDDFEPDESFVPKKRQKKKKAGESASESSLTVAKKKNLVKKSYPELEKSLYDVLEPQSLPAGSRDLMDWWCFYPSHSFHSKAEHPNSDKNLLYIGSVQMYLADGVKVKIADLPSTFMGIKFVAELTIHRPAITKENMAFRGSYETKTYTISGVESHDIVEWTDFPGAKEEQDEYNALREKAKMNTTNSWVANQRTDKAIRYEQKYVVGQDRDEIVVGRTEMEFTSPTLKYFAFVLRKSSGVYFCDRYARLDAIRDAFEKNSVDMSLIGKIIGAGVNSTSMFVSKAENSKFKIPDTFESPESDPPEGFQLTLRPYQKRTLYWLLEQESDSAHHNFSMESKNFPNGDYSEAHHRCGFTVTQIGPDGPYFDIVMKKFFKVNPELYVTTTKKSIYCPGAILADDTGTGKTVTVLALIHTNPFKTLDSKMLDPFSFSSWFVSRATLVVCPSHLCAQWKLEAERCMPEANIKVLTTIVDHQKLTWNDVLEADIVITSLNFLQNKSYDTKVRDLISKETSSCPWYEKGRDNYKQELYCHRIKSKGKEVYGKEIGKVVFEHVFWYRIVCDEFHELGKSESKNKAARCFLKDLKGRFYLGVTGTPATNTARDIGEMAKYLNCDQEFSFDMAKCFVQQKIRRNEPNLELPPVENRCIWVELSVEERGLYIGMNDLTRSSLMACNHHQLADDILDIVGDGKEMSVEEVAAMVQKSRLTNIAKLSTRISNLEKSLEEAKKDYNEVLHLKKNGVLTIEVKTAEDKVEEKSIDSVLRSKLTRCESIGKNISEVERERANIQSQYNFFQTLLDAVQEGKQQNCLICLEDIVCGQKFSVGRCGHVYCCPCLDLLMASAHPRCGACRVELKREDIARIAIKKIEPETEKQEQEEKEDGDPDEPKIDYSKYGSKLGAFVEFATKTIQEEPDAKIVLFIQWRHLMKLVSKSLNEFNVNHVTCDGNVFAKSKAVTSFKTDPNVKLILLSAEDSVSGLHLTEANYVVIFHPFLMDSDKQAMDYEYQGIARSRRFGQTRTVKVVRFLVKDSVEEVLAKRRKYENAQLND